MWIAAFACQSVRGTCAVCPHSKHTAAVARHVSSISTRDWASHMSSTIIRNHIIQLTETKIMANIKTLVSAVMSAFALLAVSTTLVACSDDDEEKVVTPTCEVTLDTESISMTSASFSVKTADADSVKYVYYPADMPTVPTMDDVRQNGIKLAVANGEQTVQLTGLAEDTQYMVYVAAFGKKSVFNSGSCGFKTAAYPGFTLTAATGETYSNRNASVTFTTADGITVAVDAYYPEFKYMREGVYPILESAPTSGDVPQYVLGGAGNSRYTYLKSAGGDIFAITGGEMDVKVNTEEKTYNVNFKLTLASGDEVEARFTGAISGIDVFDEYSLNMDAARVLDIDNRQAGEFYVKMEEHTNWCEMSLDFQGDAADTALQPGTYTVSEAGGKGTISTKSNISTYSPVPAQGGYFTSGTATVEKSGDTYTIKWDVTTKEGQRFVGTYTGTITDM